MFDKLETSIQTSINLENTIADLNTLVGDLKLKLNGCDHQLNESGELLKLRRMLKQAAFGLQRTIDAPKEIITKNEDNSYTIDHRTMEIDVDEWLSAGVVRVTVDDSGDVYVSDPSVELKWVDDMSDGEWIPVHDLSASDIVMYCVGEVVDPNMKHIVPEAWLVDFGAMTARRGSTPPPYTL